ncbi:MAG: DUF4125 family protein [Oscillospiraceae bacterium]|jgi:hypothetical protein|nr:DUF4125 family protein [Oscillospiraceae bacterium]
MHRQKLITDVVNLEWEMFTNVQDASGRADCQDDLRTFVVMRSSQFSAWATDTIESYIEDLKGARADGVNLMTLKYARMMEITFPEEYAAIREALPSVEPEVLNMAALIAAVHVLWAQEIAERYPKLSALGRPSDYDAAILAGTERWAAQDNYLRSELLTYSKRTLELCLRDTVEAQAAGRNMGIEILEATVTRYGYDSLDSAESSL